MVRVSEQQLDQPWEDNEFPYSPHKHRSVEFPKSCWVTCLHQYFLVKCVWWRVGTVAELQEGSGVVCLCVWMGSVKNVTLKTCFSVHCLSQETFALGEFQCSIYFGSRRVVVVEIVFVFVLEGESIILMVRLLRRYISSPWNQWIFLLTSGSAPMCRDLLTCKFAYTCSECQYM